MPFALGQAAHRSIFSPGETALDFLVNLTDHVFQLLDEFILVASLVPCVVGVLQKLVLQKVIMPFFTRTNVSLCIGEQVVGTEGAQVVLAYVRVVEVVASCQSYKQGLIAVLAHELVEFLFNMIHT